jgi:hypothetical protein
MKLTDIVSQIVIDPRKLTGYALNPKSPLGCHKAIMFEKMLGFTSSNYTESNYTESNYTDLLMQIEKHATTEQIVLHSKDEFGYRYNMDIKVNGTEGKQAIVRVGWFIPHGLNEARLATLFVRR